jgi:hypothetical protein
MSEQEPPESTPPESLPPPTEGKDERRRRRLEGVIPEIVRRAVELGVEKAAEAPDNLKQFVGDLKVPKEIGHYLLQQIDETKNGLFRVVAKEIRDFLEHTNFAGEIQKLLTTVQFEVNTTIRFTPNDGRPKKSRTAGGRGKGDEPTDDRAERNARGERTSEAPGERGDDEGDDEDGGESESGGRSERGSLPVPEVKTSVNVHREDRERGRRRDRGGS